MLGVVRVVSGLRGRTGEWAQAAWCEGCWERVACVWGLRCGQWGGQGGLGAERVNSGMSSSCLVRGHLLWGCKCLGFGERLNIWYSYLCMCSSFAG